jgi:hypothetical protein
MRKQQLLLIVSVCVSVALAIQHAKRMRRSKYYILSVSIALVIQHAKRMRRSKYYILSVSIALVIQHAKRMRRITLSCVGCLLLPYYSTVSHKRHDFQKNFIEHKIFFSIFL